MNSIINKLLGIQTANNPVKNRVWFYQFEGQEKRKLIKRGKYWNYQTGKFSGDSIGCDTLQAAKGDLIYSGAKVWSELI